MMDMDNNERNDPDELYDEGVRLVNSGDDADLEKAAELFKEAVATGHVSSKRALGIMYLEGKGVPQDHRRAYELISDAVDDFDPFAAYVLGQMYEGGLGVEQSDKEALPMFAFAAEMGILEAETDAYRVMERIVEKRNRKLRSRPILNLEVSDADIEAACCKPMFDSVINGDIRFVDTYKGPELVREDENGMEVIRDACPL
jgi:TPR repeat protein